MKKNSNIRVRCKLCGKWFDESEMSEEHYPAHSVGNDDIVLLDVGKMLDSIIDGKLHSEIRDRMNNHEEFQAIIDDIFDNRLSKTLYPNGRTSRSLCKKCNTFLGVYDEAYLKFYKVDGDPKTVGGFQKSTKIKVIKAIYGKFLSLPEADNESFDFIRFVKNESCISYNGKWSLYFVKRDFSTDLLGLKDIRTGKLEFDEGVVYELSDDKFIFNLMNFELPEYIKMTNIFDIFKKNFSIITGLDEYGGFHGQLIINQMLVDNSENFPSKK